MTFGYPLLEHNTFGMDVRCAAWYEYASEEELLAFLGSKAFDTYRDRFFCIGAGSNLLFLGDYDGLLLHSAMRTMTVVSDDDASVLLRAGSGCVWDDVAAWAAERHLYGAENLSGIPGEVGASAVQNIGAYGAEVCQLIESVETIDTDGQRRVFTNAECRYGYRDSIFKNEMKGRCIVVSVTYRLRKQGQLRLDYGKLREHLSAHSSAGKDESLLLPADVRRAVMEIRAEKLPDPKVMGNAGSFFKNPIIPIEQYDHLKDVWMSIPSYPVDKEHVKVPAGWLIEQCGWKGRRLGLAAVHQNQALVLVNLGGASGRDVSALAQRIMDDVKRKFDVDIAPEVNYIGRSLSPAAVL